MSERASLRFTSMHGGTREAKDANPSTALKRYGSGLARQRHAREFLVPHLDTSGTVLKSSAPVR